MKPIKHFLALGIITISIGVLTSCQLPGLPSFPFPGGHDESQPNNNDNNDNNDNSDVVIPDDDTTKQDGVNVYTPLEDKTIGGYALLGPSSLNHNGSPIQSWGNYDGTRNGTMHAICIAEARNAIGKNIFYNQSLNNIKSLYRIDNVGVGTTYLEGWTQKWGPDGKGIDGSFSVKFGQVGHDIENNKDFITSWIPSPESGQVCSLTHDTYWVSPNFSEEKDENGYDWNTNPVVISGSGIYTFVLVNYKKPYMNCNYGVACVKTQDVDTHQREKGIRFATGKQDSPFGILQADFILTSPSKMLIDFEFEKANEHLNKMIDQTLSYTLENGILSFTCEFRGDEGVYYTKDYKVTLTSGGKFTLKFVTPSGQSFLMDVNVFFPNELNVFPILEGISSDFGGLNIKGFFTSFSKARFDMIYTSKPELNRSIEFNYYIKNGSIGFVEGNSYHPTMETFGDTFYSGDFIFGEDYKDMVRMIGSFLF